jgi:hypothetical protein
LTESEKQKLAAVDIRTSVLVAEVAEIKQYLQNFRAGASDNPDKPNSFVTIGQRFRELWAKYA